jgi:SAM-dependent methyltransferase
MFKGNIYQYTKRYLDTLGSLSGKLVVDIPAGSGHISQEFARRGARVIALDLYPEQISVKDVEKLHADMNERLPLENDVADIVLCQEGIEHIHNQFDLLKEFNRVLKPGGKLIITTPSLSHIRARLSMMLIESEYWKRLPASEVDSVWFSEQDSERVYFGHLYLITANHLRAISSITGFEIEKRLVTQISTSSALLSVIFYPLILLGTVLAFLDSYRKNRKSWNTDKMRVYKEQMKINLSPVTLMCKDIFWVLKKKRNWLQTLEYLKSFQR